MSTTAIVMMVFSMTVLWGGLIAAIVHLLRSSPVHEPNSDDIALAVQDRDL